MNQHATGTIEGRSWDEKPYSEFVGGPKLTRASVSNYFHGDLEGEGKLEYLMVYRNATSGSFVGLEQVVGHIGDRSGSFVLQHSGTFEDGVVKTAWFVVPGSGTDDFQAIHGDGGFIAHHGEQLVPFTLDYEFQV